MVASRKKGPQGARIKGRPGITIGRRLVICMDAIPRRQTPPMREAQYTIGPVTGGKLSVSGCMVWN
jgi:hypothetical protein